MFSGRNNPINRTAVGALTGFLTLSLASGAHGQTLDPSGLTFDQLAPRLHIAAALDAHYDSNVARASDEVTERRNLRRSDFVLSPSINADIVAPTAAATFTLAGYVGYDFYLRNSRLNRERIDLNASASRRLSICDVSLNAGISRRQTDLGDLQIVTGQIDESIVNTESQWRVGGNVGCGATIGFQPMVYGSYRQQRRGP